VTTILAGSKVGFAFRTLAFKKNFDRGWNNRAAQGTSQNLLKVRHVHPPRLFLRFRPARPAFRLFLWFLALLLAVATVVHIAVLAVFSIHIE